MKGADLNAVTRSGSTLLHCAVRNGHKEMVEMLLAKGSDLRVADTSGNTPLHIAAERGHKEVVEVLLNNGADAFIKNKWWRTAVDRAYDDELRAIILDDARKRLPAKKDKHKG